MKTIFFLLTIGFSVVGFNATAQQQVVYTTNQPATHIQGIENASYQNNSQFYNKDNALGTGTTNGGNATYSQPGYSNPINSSYDRKVGSNNSRLQSVSIYGYENVYLTKPVTNDNAKYGK